MLDVRVLTPKATLVIDCGSVLIRGLKQQINQIRNECHDFKS